MEVATKDDGDQPDAGVIGGDETANDDAPAATEAEVVNATRAMSQCCTWETKSALLNKLLTQRYTRLPQMLTCCHFYIKTSRY